MNSEKCKIPDLQRLLLNLSDKINHPASIISHLDTPG